MKDEKLILSISFCFHDSCITLANEKEILIHLEAERIFREKHKKFNNLEEVDYLVSSLLLPDEETVPDIVSWQSPE